MRGRYLAPLGLFAGFVDATLLASGRIEPRKVVGSVDTSEFLVSVAASAGFLAALGGHGVRWDVVAALLAGGLVAAPLAAWLVQKVTARLLGALVGVLIVLTNARTLADVASLGSARWWLYAAILLVWSPWPASRARIAAPGSRS